MERQDSFKQSWKVKSAELGEVAGSKRGRNLDKAQISGSIKSV